MAVYDKGYYGSFSIPTPKGVYQAAGDTNINADYAYRAENMRTERGLLATAYGTGRAFPALGYPIETFTRFYRRNRPDDPEVYVAAANGAIYTYTPGEAGWAERKGGFFSNAWSYVTYETVEDGQTVDILLMTNREDGMIVVYGSDLRVEAKTLTIGDDYKAVKFAVLGRHAERIWGTGDPAYPDNIFYSRPYDPFDWTAVEETPELGGGMIQQPTWDGDSFIALEPFGGYLLAIKPHTIFEIRGTDPSSFTITEAYGTDGPMQTRTIVTDRLRMLFLARGGLGMYDGSTLSLLSRDALYETMRMRMPGTDDKATACVCDHVYYLALCVREREDDVLTENNTVVEFDTERGTFMIRKGIRVKDFYSIGGKVYFTRADDPFEILRYNDPEAEGYLGVPMESMWETPWFDLDKRSIKSEFTLRFTAETDFSDVPLEIYMATDRRERKKVVMLQKGRKDYAVSIHTRGKRVKLRLRSHAKAASWRIHGGILVEFTTEEE